MGFGLALWSAPGRAKELNKHFIEYCRANATDIISEVYLIEMKESPVYGLRSVRFMIKLRNGLYLHHSIMSIRGSLNSFTSLAGYFTNRSLESEIKKLKEMSIIFVDSFITTKWKLKVEPRIAKKHTLFNLYKRYEHSLKMLYESNVKPSFKRGQGIVHVKSRFISDEKEMKVNAAVSAWFKGVLFNKPSIKLLEEIVRIAESHFSQKINQEGPLSEEEYLKVYTFD